MAGIPDVRTRTKSIVVGVVDNRCSGSLAYALKVALEESATVRIVRVSDGCPSSRIALRLPIHTVEAVGDPLDILIQESRDVELMVVEGPRGAAAARNDPLLTELRQLTETLLVEVDHRGEIVRASGPSARSGIR